MGRLSFWSSFVWRRTVQAVVTVTTLATAWSLLHERLPESWKGKVEFLDIISDRPWYVWALVGLAALLLITLEAVYHLEEQRRPKLEIVPDTSEQQHPNRMEVAAILRIRNLGRERIRDCCVKVVELKYKQKATIDGKPEEWWYPLFEGQDIYLRWRGASESSTQYFTFQSEAIAEVGVSHSSGGSVYLLGDIKSRPELHLGIADDYLLTLEISAENAPPETRTYELRMDSGRIRRDTLGQVFTVTADEVHFQEVSA
jgi:hypothetical protein